uniref:Uncharacterized protein n=1 Tax=Panagrellus redivivus TaxID=6233 RepID=A0A7E4WE04_PANRE
MVFTTKDQHFIALASVHFIIATCFFIFITELVHSPNTDSVIVVAIFIGGAVLHFCAAAFGCVIASKKLKSLTKDHHCIVLALDLLPLIIETVTAAIVGCVEIAGGSGLVILFNLFAIYVINEHCRTGINPDYVDGYVPPTFWQKTLAILSNHFDAVGQQMGYLERERRWPKFGNNRSHLVFLEMRPIVASRLPITSDVALHHFIASNQTKPPYLIHHSRK